MNNCSTSGTYVTPKGTNPKFLAALALTACLIAMSAAHAHGIWFAQRATQLALLYGIGSDDLDSVKRLPLVESIAGYDADWKPIPTKPLVATVSPSRIRRTAWRAETILPVSEARKDATTG